MTQKNTKSLSLDVGKTYSCDGDVYTLMSLTATIQPKIIQHWFKSNETIMETKFHVVVSYGGEFCCGAKVIDFNYFVQNAKSI